jgi:hypothetical protein
MPLKDNQGLEALYPVKGLINFMEESEGSHGRSC